MSEIVALRPTEVTASFAPIPELIQELEKLIEQARTGKLRACAWAVVYEADAKPDGEVAHGWARGPYTVFALSHAVEKLAWQWKAKEHG